MSTVSNKRKKSENNEGGRERQGHRGIVTRVDRKKTFYMV